MALDPNINTREAAKFAEALGGATAVRVIESGDVDSFAPAIYDTVLLAYLPAGDLDTVTFKLGGATIRVLTMAYTSGDLTSIVAT